MAMRTHRFRHTLSAVVAVMAAVGLMASGASPAAAGVPDPASDPFYAQPASFAGTHPGGVLNSRQVTITGLGIPLPYASYQVQYVTENTVGVPQANVATIIKPLHTTGPAKLVSYQPAIDSLSYLCDPSYLLRQGTEAEAVTIGNLLTKGWTVVEPDFLGPNHEWTAGVIEGKGTLDGIRAAENFAPVGLNGTATPVGMTGYSGGARGTEFAAELAPAYAPELKIVGAAPGGVSGNIGNVAKGANGGAFAGIYFAAAMGIGRAYPEVGIDSLLNAKGKKMEAAIGKMCIAQFSATYAFQRIQTYTVNGVDPLTLPAIQKVIDQIKAGALGTPRVPLHIYMASYDELVVTPDTDKLVQQYCAKGLTVQYVKYPLAEHVTALAEGFPVAVAWLSDRFAGRTAPSTC